MPEACLVIAKSTNTLLGEPCYGEGRLRASAQEVVLPPANAIQLTNRLWPCPGAAMVGHLHPFPCRLLPEDLEEHSSTAKGVSCGAGNKGTALCQEKAPADLGQTGPCRQNTQPHPYRGGARDTKVLCVTSSLISLMHKTHC